MKIFKLKNFHHLSNKMDCIAAHQNKYFIIGTYAQVYPSGLSGLLGTAKIPGMSKAEQGVKNQFKGINLLSSPEPLKQLCCTNTLVIH